MTTLPSTTSPRQTPGISNWRGQPMLKDIDASWSPLPVCPPQPACPSVGLATAGAMPALLPGGGISITKTYKLIHDRIPAAMPVDDGWHASCLLAGAGLLLAVLVAVALWGIRHDARHGMEGY